MHKEDCHTAQGHTVVEGFLGPEVNVPGKTVGVEESYRSMETNMQGTSFSAAEGVWPAGMSCWSPVPMARCVGCHKRHPLSSFSFSMLGL